MTHRGLVIADSIEREKERINRIKALESRLTQSCKLYSLYERDKQGSWKRISDNSYSEILAYRVFTTRLMNNPTNRSIRPIKLILDGVR